MNKLKTNKLIKSHGKRAFKGDRLIFINKFYFYKLLYKIEHVSKKTKKWLFRRLAKKRLVLNYRFFFRIFNSNLNIQNLKIKYYFNPLFRIFYKFNFVHLISLEHFKITDYHLELIRRLARKIFGKRIYINLYVQANFVLLRRANQVRMGGGKGAKFYKKIYFLYPGCNILEVRGINLKYVTLFNNKLKKKLPFLFKVLLLNRC